MKKINEMTLREKVGQLFMVGFQDGEDVTKRIEKYKFGNIIYFSRNLYDAHKIADMSKSIQKTMMEVMDIPAIISTDQEGGMVSRFKAGATTYNGAMAIGATGDVALANDIGQRVGKELLSYGVNMNLAPVLDVNVNEENPVIGVRSFSDDKETVHRFGSAFAKGLQSSGVIACGKHFPGHGDTNVDSHLSLPLINLDRQRLEELELYPFKKAIDEGLDSIMVAHLLIPSLEPDDVPATMSRKIVTEILMNTLDFKGLILTDCLEMHAFTENFDIVEGAVKAILAGVDILCISHTESLQISVYDGILQAVNDGIIPMDMLDDRVTRVLDYKEKYNIAKTLKGIKVIDDVDLESNIHHAEYVAMQSVTLVKDRDGLLPIDKGEKLYVVSPRRKSFTIADDTLGTADFAKTFSGVFGCDYYSYDSCDDVTADELAIILDKCRAADKVVVGSYISSVVPTEKAFVEKIIDACSNVIVVALLLPYDARLGGDSVSTSICLYEYTKKAVDAAISRMQTGDFKGVLPIKLY